MNLTERHFKRMLPILIRGYANFIRGALTVLLGAAVLIATGTALVYPLWLFASASPELYTAVVLVALVTGGLLLAARWFVKEARSNGGMWTPLRRFARAVGRVLAGVFIVLGVYVDLILFQTGRMAAGFLLAAILICAVGFLFSGSRSGSTKRSRNVA